jgi:hypothetical protein
MLIFQKLIFRMDLQLNPDVLYVFGDNMQRIGFGGQAKEMRGEPNAVGLPTKLSPGQYFSNNDLNRLKIENKNNVSRLISHLRSGGVVVWPADGIGTGLADLKNKAPKIMDYYDNLLESLRTYK